MMKKVVIALCLTLACGSSSILFGKDVTPLQLFFLVKQAFPDKQELAILITKEQYEEQETKIKRATVQMKIKAIIHMVSGSKDVGRALQKVADNAIVVLFDSEALTKQATRLYVLSKCKEKRISLVTTSKPYGESGALLCLYNDKADKLTILLNLKKNLHEKGRFTDALVQKLGVSEVVM